MPTQKEPIPGIGPDPEEVRLNRFTYEQDPTGSACPFVPNVFERFSTVVRIWAGSSS